MASSFRHLLDFLQKRMRMSTVCTRHQSSRARLVQSALAFLKLDEATSLTGISFPPFPTFPISPPPGSGAGNVGNAGNVFGGDDLEPFFLADWEPLLHLKARRWPW